MYRKERLLGLGLLASASVFSVLLGGCAPGTGTTARPQPSSSPRTPAPITPGTGNLRSGRVNLTPTLTAGRTRTPTQPAKTPQTGSGGGSTTAPKAPATQPSVDPDAPTSTPSEHPGTPTATPSEQPGEPLATPPEQPAEVPAEPPAEQPAEQPAEPPAEQPAAPAETIDV
ncbi:MAG: hypothetical protein HY815_24750 [Candidatus Riflebacteria bacterium]|nr:hypothetical protein [Candidatus Riflebacteria bacterium]